MSGKLPESDLHELLPTRQLGAATKLLSILRYYRWSQIAHRIAKASGVKRRSLRPAPPTGIRVRLDGLPRLETLRTWRIRFSADAEEAQSYLRDHSICLLNSKLDFGFPPDMHVARPKTLPLLWRFQFHYQEYLLHWLHEPNVLVEFLDAWLDAFDEEQPDAVAWHPYCISRRLPTWSMLLEALPKEGSTSERLLQSFGRQAEYLANHLELDVRGNHLLENLRGLTFAACMIQGECSERWLAKVLANLVNELREQVLPTGEHFERAPMYHCHVASVLLEMSVLTDGLNVELARLCRDNFLRMQSFLGKILHSDGEIPLFADSGFGEALPARAISPREANQLSPELSGDATTSGNWQPLTPQAMSTGMRSTLEGDYWVVRDRHLSLIADLGQVGADSLPAHAHCDLLNFELSIHGHRFVVDSGNYNYESDEMRRYCRSSIAHNVLVVDQENHCDVWSKFRMGYRGRIRWKQSGIDQDLHWCWAAHDAYRRIGIPTVERVLAVVGGQTVICIDRIDARRPHRLQSFLHFHPDITLSPTGPNQIQVGDQAPWHMASLCEASLKTYQGWYCPSFGVRQRNSVAAVESTDSSVVGWVLSEKALAEDAVLIDDSAEDSITFVVNSNSYSIRCDAKNR